MGLNYPDPQMIKAVFGDRAEAVAAYVQDGIGHVGVAGAMLAQVGGSVSPFALATNGGGKRWRHSGNVIDLRTYIDGSPADLRPALDAAITEAAARYAETGARHTVTAGGIEVPISSPIFGGGRRGVVIEGMHVTPVTGSSWSADTAMFMVNSDTWYWSFTETFSADGKQACPGVIRASNVEYLQIDGVFAKGFTEFGIRTRSKCGQLHVARCNIGQFLWGETGWNQEADRTAIGYDIATADYQLIGNNGYFCDKVVSITTQGPGQFIGNHLFNGMPSPDGFPPATFTQDPVNAFFDAPNVNCLGNYFDNGLVRIQADTLQLGNNPSMQFIGNRLHRTGAAANTKDLEFRTATANTTLAGLIMVGNSFAQFNPLRWATTGSGSFVAPHQLQCVVSGNLTNAGAYVGPDLPRELVPNAFAVLGTNLMALRNQSTGWGTVAMNSSRNGLNVAPL